MPDNRFRIDWLEDLRSGEREEIERAVAAAVPTILRSARFARRLAWRKGEDLEVRVWLASGLDPLQVLVWWEPRMGVYWFPIVDPNDGTRVGLLVFDDLPTADRALAERDGEEFLRALAGVAPEGTGMSLSDVRSVVSGRLADPGVKP